MRGYIYSDERCPICRGRFKDDGKSELICPTHPNQKATRFRVRFGKGVQKRFGRDYQAASRFLTVLRYKANEGTFDPRDYSSKNPLGFHAQAEKWLSIKETEVKKGAFKNLRNYMRRASEYWGDRNVKEIDYAEIEDFLTQQTLLVSGKPVSSKTKANIRYALHAFFVWLRKRRIIPFHLVPEFPEVKFELGFRRVIDKATQEAILDEIHRISYHINPKIWLGIKWLMTYISIRPGELVTVKEHHLDLENGYIVIPHPKEKKPKLVPLLEKDVQLIKSLPRGMPDLPFFRHGGGIKGCKAGQPFGEKYFYKWWKRACENLGIRGVDLYGGTRHSSARALRQYRTPEEIRRATMHSTNKAFERYFWIESDDLREIYRDAENRKEEKGKLLKFEKPTERVDD